MAAFSNWINTVTKQVTNAISSPTNENSDEKQVQQQNDDDKEKVNDATSSSTTESWLSMAKQATRTVVERANVLTTSVKEASMLSDFDAAQREFASMTPSSGEASAAAARPPWANHGEQTIIMKKHILALSLDGRNFTRAPPPGSDFTFDMTAFNPTALACLAEDANLRKMRFQLVPKVVSETNFWRNYFYRVSLVEQSIKIQNCNNDDNHLMSTTSRTQLTEDERQQVRSQLTQMAMERSAPTAEQIASKSADDNDNDDVDGNKNVDNGENSATTNWEQDVLAELNDFELVHDGTLPDTQTQADWEKEISDLLDSTDVETTK